MKRLQTRLQRQQGIALALVLVLLVVTTMIGTTALRTSRIQEQLAGATYDRTVARAAGDAAMVDANLYVYSPSFEPVAAALAPVFTSTDGWTIDSWRNLNFDWLGGPVQKLGDGGTATGVLLNVLANPTYVVERIPSDHIEAGKKEDAFRLTVRATGGRVTTEHYSMAIVVLPSN